SLPAHIAERDAELLRAITKKIVQVATQLPRRNDPRSNLQAKFRAWETRQQCALNAARSVEIALHAAFIAGDLFVQAGVFDRYREVRGKDRKHLNVVRGEIVELGTLQVHHANDAIFVHHRDGQFGPRFGVQHAVPRIEGYVGNSDRAAELRGRTDN